MTNVSETENNKNGNKPGILKIMQSVLAGAIGVQSNRRREEDFSSHSPWPYIIAGVLFTAIFVAGLIVVVQLVIANQ
ncbi:MAG: DUF2970 domain-containing protein [Gammaproteobacteria bacterium]|uniref:DUF2970 domain-containing protein n=1 Tax=Marinobacter nitratireducens TaxID=1137280 RepID=A0A072NGU2_9GAMM|nr:DUF2970 domain-containing protein [Marinobacter nitratireducens]KEF32345.1 hypothetical protein D777_00979 [Marinobacter nitratireducens]TNE77437.1 MAG: DUF2970 domain-containing protein [Gammaproteobacteria bacterium]